MNTIKPGDLVTHVLNPMYLNVYSENDDPLEENQFAWFPEIPAIVLEINDSITKNVKVLIPGVGTGYAMGTCLQIVQNVKET